MAEFWIYVLVGLITVFVMEASAVVFTMEAEDFVTDLFAIHRDNAGGRETINFNQGQTLLLHFCLRTESEVAIHNVRYSNDGGWDKFEVNLDGRKLGVVTTAPHTAYGRNWDLFMSTKQIGPVQRLSGGRHTIVLNFTMTDYYGAEIDQVQVRVEDPLLTENLFDCDLFCFDDIKYDNGPTLDEASSARIEKNMHSTTCPEEDNIRLPIYHEDIDMYMLTAMLPKYRSFENHQELDLQGCPSPQNELWRFDNFAIPMTHDYYGLVSGQAALSFKANNDSRTSDIGVKFNVKGPSIGKYDSEAGAVLKIRFKSVIRPFYVEMKYKGRDEVWSDDNFRLFSPQEMENIWIIPKHSWSEFSENEVSLHFVNGPSTTSLFEIEYMSLTKNKIEYEKDIRIYDSNHIKVEITDVKFSETENKKMSVRRIDNNQVWDSVSFIKIIYSLPLTNQIGEIFRLYQSGTVQIKPVTPIGLHATPFGTSIVTGFTDPNEDMPTAPIKHIEIDPAAFQLFLTYEDNSTCNFLLKPTLHTTRLIVKDVKPGKDNEENDNDEKPFAVIKSMWIHDGNSEIDHVSSNGNEVHHVTSDWDTLYGTSFTFFRKCISKHNTQSPDLRLQMITKHDLHMLV